ncbi:MAG TPA: EAL domain-containing protein, partial [Burkholderiaceae bacterium]|nr:EAL domain-containing protein [Burkholderiaceae bacterium]
NSLQFFTRAMDAAVQERSFLESALRTAIERSELELHYQPQVDLRTGRVVGVEALVRWHHPKLGNVPPSQFIAIAEECGMINPIGKWVLRTASHQARAWQQGGFGDLRMAVNISARQFAQPGLVKLVASVLNETQLPGHLLDIELTERLIMRNVEHTIETLNALRVLGVQLSIDDFGTGYSSLAYLKRFPINVLKIDQSFVREIPHNANDAAISDAIVSMAHRLGIRVIAEGVETEAQCEFLSRKMCDEIQGYLFSPPLPAAHIELLLTGQRRLPEHLLRTRAYSHTLDLADSDPGALA